MDFCRTSECVNLAFVGMKSDITERIPQKRAIRTKIVDEWIDDIKE